MAKPEDRSKAAAAVAKACGGKLHQYFMSLGEYDFMAVMEFHNVEAATACSMAVAAGGHVSGMTTTKLLMPAEAMKAMAIANTAAPSLLALEHLGLVLPFQLHLELPDLPVKFRRKFFAFFVPFFPAVRK